MGLRSYISNATKSDFWKPKGDKLLWVAIIVLALASLLFVYSATGKLAYRKNEGFTSFYLWKQVCLLLIGYLVIICVQNFSIKRVINWSALLLTGSIILMLVSWALGHQQNGAGRWIYLPGGFSFQPSEIAKLCVILYVAKEISFRQVEGVGYNFLWRRWILPLIAILLIFKDDVSTAIILATTCFIVVCVGGLPWKRIFGFLAVVILLGVLGFATINYIPPSTLENLSHVSVFHRLPTVQNRIHRFISPIPLSERDIQSVKDDQTVQSEIAIASGRFVGKGPGNSTQCNVMAEPYSDFIFAIIMEESGLIGLGVVLICYILIFISAFRVMFRCSSLFIGLVVWGIVVSLLLQAIIHMAVCVGLLPITGQTLPLLSKGGTSLLVVAFELGIVLSASLEPEREREEEERLRLEEEAELAREGYATNTYSTGSYSSSSEWGSSTSSERDSGWGSERGSSRASESASGWGSERGSSRASERDSSWGSERGSASRSESSDSRESDDLPWEIDETEADEVFHAETPKDITDHWRYD